MNATFAIMQLHPTGELHRIMVKATCPFYSTSVFLLNYTVMSQHWHNLPILCLPIHFALSYGIFLPPEIVFLSYLNTQLILLLGDLQWALFCALHTHLYPFLCLPPLLFCVFATHSGGMCRNRNRLVHDCLIWGLYTVSLCAAQALCVIYLYFL